jgi:hypothetical protein
MSSESVCQVARSWVDVGSSFLFVWIGLQPVLHHQQVYHGIFTEVSTDLQCFTSVIQALCYYEVVSGFGCI